MADADALVPSEQDAADKRAERKRNFGCILNVLEDKPGRAQVDS